MSGENEVIDLTDSFIVTDLDNLMADIIELDDSMYYFPPSFPSTNYEIPKRQRETNKAKANQKSSTYKTSQENLLQKLDRNKSPKRIGECPVCWDELGKNPLASTKCGHVFCLQCIEQVIQQTPKCPTCRSNLKGRSAYHALYLPLK